MAANRGTFATAQVGVPAGNGFGGGVIYYPTDTSQGKFGALAVVPGYTATWAAEGAWMGHWLASFGFVVIGIDTNNRNDWYTARGEQLLAALDYLTQRSSVRDRVDGSRAAVMGHSMGGGGAVYAGLRRPSLKATLGMAPAIFSENLSNLRVPTMLMAGQNDGTVTPSAVTGNYNQIPGTTEKAYLELSGAGHGFPTSNNSVMTRKVIPWLKIFLDRDARYSQFLCPLMDNTGIRTYRSTCPLLPDVPPSPSNPPSPSTPPSPSIPPSPPSASPSPSTPPVPGACSAAYRVVNSWPGGYQAEITVTAGGSAINGWTVRWTLGAGQSISQSWNAVVTTSGSQATARNAGHNGALGVGSSTTFGFIGAGTPTNPTLACTSP